MRTRVLNVIRTLLKNHSDDVDDDLLLADMRTFVADLERDIQQSHLEMKAAAGGSISSSSSSSSGGGGAHRRTASSGGLLVSPGSEPERAFGSGDIERRATTAGGVSGKVSVESDEKGEFEGKSGAELGAEKGELSMDDLTASKSDLRYEE